MDYALDVGSLPRVDVVFFVRPLEPKTFRAEGAPASKLLVTCDSDDTYMCPGGIQVIPADKRKTSPYYSPTLFGGRQTSTTRRRGVQT